MNHPAPIQLPSAGQGTVIESSRAMAEVAAMVRIAMDNPRDVDRAEREMMHACGRTELASQAFFSFPRAGGAVNGPSVHLARELARVWGNITYGVTELRRDDRAGESEMLAFAWDVQTNTRMAHIFIQPHAKDTRQGRKALTELRDVYENNANAGARRVREAIFGVIPAWFREQAMTACRATLERPTEEPLPDRIENAMRKFEADYGVSGEQLVAKVGRSVEQWQVADLVNLVTLYQSLKRGELNVVDAFPPQQQAVSAQEILGEK